MKTSWLDGVDPDMRTKILMCSIADGNALRCSEDRDHVALFVAAARFNHSCAPNATLESTRTTALVRSNTSIPAGTEVTISYLPEELLSDADTRRSRLKIGRDFDCRCSRCVLEGYAISEPVDSVSTETISLR